jgi:hypothetical protein
MKLTLPRAALFGSVLVAIIHIVMLGQALAWEQTIEIMVVQVQTLLSNAAGLQRIQDGQLDLLKEDVEQANLEVEALESSFPVPGAPFALYDRGFVMAAQNEVKIISISRHGRELLETAFGTVDSSNFGINAEANLENCLEFINRLELAGINTIAVNNIVIEPENLICDFDVQTLGIVEQPDA